MRILNLNVPHPKEIILNFFSDSLGPDKVNVTLLANQYKACINREVSMLTSPWSHRLGGLCVCMPPSKVHIYLSFADLLISCIPMSSHILMHARPWISHASKNFLSTIYIQAVCGLLCHTWSYVFFRALGLD